MDGGIPVIPLEEVMGETEKAHEGGLDSCPDDRRGVPTATSGGAQELNAGQNGREAL